MAKYRSNLPLLDKDRIYLGEGGIMTDMFFGEETKDVKVPPSNLLFQFIKDEKEKTKQKYESEKSIKARTSK